MRKISRLESFRCALDGIGYTLKTQRNAQIHLGISAAVVGLALWLKVGRLEWAVLILTMGLVISAEMLNTVAEAAMDFAAPEYHPQVKIIKDVAAGAVLVTALAAVGVGLLILGPPLWQKLAPFLLP
ncbi:MAG: diacylglycerol kinase family protein [Chloroflexi bacterium]|nr:MAG: diacylglycerol kinase family protein [Chloroflexota bacterium]